MKRIKLIMLCLITAVTVNAQGIGIKAGVNLANVSEDPKEVDFNMKLGFQIGVVYETELSQSLFFAPSLTFSQKGAKASNQSNGNYISKELLFNYLEVPLNLVYKINLNGPTLVVEAGPYLGYAISGKHVMKGKILEISIDESENIRFGDGEDELKRIEYGINGGMGIELSSIKIVAEYRLGFVNLGNKSDQTNKNRVIGLSAVYFFGR